ncbi:MAG: uroporphyrinogen decarboxylase family protein [Coriobacteriales bacterium]|nr:uroporphyrinogen decarboxylase family protein [Coriobacteriales bacterium]
MLSRKENLLATIRGENPDRFVQQYEAFVIFTENPFHVPWAQPGGGPVKDAWGITQEWREGQIGQFPIHDEEHIVCKDIEHWQEYVHAPKIEDFTRKDWQFLIDEVEKVDRSDQFVLPMIFPGLFEMTHYLMEIKNALIAFYEYPDEMHELINYIADYELRMAEQWCEYVQPDGVFHHDDWGTQISTFLSPEMFAEFFLEPYKRVYKFWKENTKEGLVVHHADCYAATLVPYMIEMGIDIWQGPQTTNDLPALIERYGDKITFMGGIDSGKVDKADWSKDDIRYWTEKACHEYGAQKKYYVPCLSQGLGISSFDGVYDYTSEVIRDMSVEMFGAPAE